MIRNDMVLRGVAALSLVLALGITAAAQQQQAPAYTVQEYNAYQACASEQNPQLRVKCLNDFAVNFPQSTLLPYADQLYLRSYIELKDHPKVIEIADKMAAQNIDDGTRLQVHYQRALSFHYVFNERDAAANAQAEAALKAARAGLDALNKIPKPQEMSAADFENQKKGPQALFHYTAGLTAFHLKRFDEAIRDLNVALANNPNDGLTYFRLGLAYLQKDNPQHHDGFWALARAIALKAPGEAQVRTYLRSQLLRYQMNGCENLVDAQMNQLLDLAATNGTRPGEFHIYSSAELQATREEIGGNFLSALQEGGDRARKTFHAFCGLPFPEVFGKVIEVTDGNDSVILKLFLGATAEETQAGTEANMEVKVNDQPDAKRLADYKDWPVRFSGTLSSYTADPFMVYWTDAKVNPEDIPEASPAPGKAKRPGKRPPR